MANEITFTGSLSVNKPSIMPAADGASVVGLQFTMNGIYYVKNTLTIATTITQIPLGQVTAPHWSFWQNLDPTNYVQITNGNSGNDFLRLYPGECAFCPLEITANPYAIANTAAIQLYYVIFSY